MLLEHIMEHLWEEHRIKVEKLVGSKTSAVHAISHANSGLTKFNCCKSILRESFSMLLNNDVPPRLEIIVSQLATLF